MTFNVMLSPSSFMLLVNMPFILLNSPKKSIEQEELLVHY